MSRHPAALRARPGFSLVELMITMVMISVVGAAIVTVFNSQQRFTRAASDVGGIRTQLQAAVTLLPAELRNISASGNDITYMSDSSIAVRSTIATSIVCAMAGNVVTLAPSGDLTLPTTAGGTTRIRLTSTIMDPAPNDGLFIWHEGASAASGDDEWDSILGPSDTPYKIKTVVKTPGACAATYAPAGNTLPALVLTIDPSTPLLAGLRVGAAVRIARPVRYGLYQSSADNRWYLGYRDAALPAYEYLAGPFVPHAVGPTSGLLFRYYDAVGAEITNHALRNDVARIDIYARARTATESSLGGSTKGQIHEDWLLTGVSIRNRN